MLILRMLQKTLIVLFLLAGMQTAAGQQQDDPLYSGQWHLKNTGQDGGTRDEDINVAPVWNKQLEGRGLVRGQGIYISIVDGDLQLDHPDLIENISTIPDHNHDYYPNTTDTGSHATSVAGIAAARGYNGMGVRGVAPWATIYSLNILGTAPSNRNTSLSGNNILDAMTQNSTITAVSNNSWGPIRPFQPSVSFRKMWENAVDIGITKGFYGKGTVYVRAAGNSHYFRIDRRTWVGGADNANYDAYANYHASVAVCAVDYQGKRSTFSELGANLWVCAPSGTSDFTSDGEVTDRNGIVTTSRPSTYTATFSGTSAATPMVSGMVALIRQANPDLSWRDVKLILANSARQNDPMDDGWEQGSLKYDLFSGESEEKYHFNHKYGFGVVNAQKAVELAENWTDLPDRIADTAVEDVVNWSGIQSMQRISIQSDINFIEYVDIPVTFGIEHISELSMKLISPSGTISNLMTYAQRSITLKGRGFDGAWRFGSARHLGEDPSGIWTLELRGRGDIVDLTKWGLRIRGYQIKIDASPAVGLSDLNINTTTMTLSLLGAKWKENLKPGDFRLKNAPAELIIEKVDTTSDTQVVRLKLKLNAGFAEDYLFEVEATTGTVSSFAKPLASNSIQLASNTQIIVRENAAIPDGVVGSNYSFTMDNLFASSQTLSYTISGNAPPGLEIDGSILRGEPETVGDYRLEVVATREDDEISRTAFFVLRILPDPNIIRVQIKVFLEGTVVPVVPVVNICDRTPQVQNKILSHTGSKCEEVPKDRLNSITSLDLSGQGITSLKEGDFLELSNLAMLDLSGNSLSTLSSGVFTGLTNLQTLNLSNSSIRSLPSGVFSELANLQILNLSSNPVLATLSSDVFTGLDKLNELYLVGFIAITRCPTIKTELEAMGISLTTFDCRFPFVSQ